jgi:5-methylcytosine-specific restriction endonuclease McrA
MPPTADVQIGFLVKLQRLLDEGAFVASYKFALLLALADLCIEFGNDTGAPLAISTDNIAERFIRYYWEQSRPYPAPDKARILQQNTGKQAAIINLVQEARSAHGGSLTSLMRDRPVWRRLVRQVVGVVRIMPLWKLQTVGKERMDFLYENTGACRVIELRPGVAYCFRKFHALISDQVRGAWLRYVRQQNLDVLGETTDLNEFLFGSERNNLAVVRPVLMDLQRGRCFYCQGPITGTTAHVDQFIAWSRYPTDLAQNFVLADSRCNNKKRDRLPACEHLARWTERNEQYGVRLGQELAQRSVVAELTASNRVTQWAYAQTEAANGLTWVQADEMVPLDAGWRELIDT